MVSIMVDLLEVMCSAKLVVLDFSRTTKTAKIHLNSYIKAHLHDDENAAFSRESWPVNL